MKINVEKPGMKHCEKDSDNPASADWQQPDAFARRLRGGCGFTFGLIGGGIWVLKEVIDPGWPAVLAVLAIGVTTAVLAIRYGDRFWDEVLGTMRDW